MDTKDLEKARKNLEDDISNYVADRFNTFEEYTGVGIKDISIKMQVFQILKQNMDELGCISTEIHLDI